MFKLLNRRNQAAALVIASLMAMFTFASAPGVLSAPTLVQSSNA